MSRRYRRRPVEVEAIQWTGNEADIPEVFAFLGDNLHDDGSHKGGAGIGYTPPDGCIYIPTREGTMTASPGDWIICEPFPTEDRHHFYPCKSDIFRATFEPVEGDDDDR